MPERHLHLAVSDIVEPMPGQVLADATHLDELLGFVHAWDRAEPMLIHCFAGVSRSTAAAYIAACALAPSATSSPSRGRSARPRRPPRPTPAWWRSPTMRSDGSGRMSEAIAEIGRGEACFEGTPFTLELN